MNSTDLVPVFTGELSGESVQLVNARDLHAFLGVSRDFSTWIKKRLEDGGFVLNHDYLLTKTGEQVSASFDSPVLGNQNQRGGDRRSIDYHLTLETAKHIGMMERNKKGQQIRAYFIDCERRAQARLPANALPDEVEAAVDQEAHALWLKSFAPIRAALADVARQRLDSGESPAKVAKGVGQGSPLIGDMLLVQAADLWPLTTTIFNLATSLSAVMDAPMRTLHKLEAKTGRHWYQR